MRLLGIDVGTGGTRAVLIDAEGRIVASSTVEHLPFASPETGWAEQDPRDWWRAATVAIRDVLSKSLIEVVDRERGGDDEELRAFAHGFTRVLKIVLAQRLRNVWRKGLSKFAGNRTALSAFRSQSMKTAHNPIGLRR